ncbi:oxidoreductase-like domain-containing protein 1 [Galleria mellonella]|uniref:Oxidoreductase-like domain-containing protein 1 n=1 Tax=Galleria mellonella TaxID=7137 RepID=A0A6J1WG25_GALME|nr:oxidoreductase-like domain-containing protein 1 [Galleria mellonella]
MLRSKLVFPRLSIFGQYTQRKSYTSASSVTEEEKEKELERIARDASIDEPPTACCQSGCANCVFIVWAEALTSKMDNAGPEIAEKILKLVEDPSMKAYLEMELRLRGLKK